MSTDFTESRQQMAIRVAYADDNETNLFDYSEHNRGGSQLGEYTPMNDRGQFLKLEQSDIFASSDKAAGRKSTPGLTMLNATGTRGLPTVSETKTKSRKSVFISNLRRMKRSRKLVVK